MGKKSHSNYMVIFPFVRIIKIMGFLLMVGCHDPSQGVRELDNLSTRYLDLFLEQEQQWAEALREQDSEKARSAVDSMDRILASFFYEADLATRPYAAEDSSLFHATVNLWMHLQMISDSVYPHVKAITLLPEMEFTYREHGQLKQILQYHDSLLQGKLQKLQLERESFWEIKTPER